MRSLLAVLALPLALALWAGSLWWGLPWGVSLRLEPRAATTATTVTTTAPPLWRLEVTAPFAHLEGLAVGDRVQFDRYGLLPPTRGSVHCVPMTGEALQLTPVGGALDHAGSVQITRGAPGVAGCPEPAPSLAPVLSLHAGRPR